MYAIERPTTIDDPRPWCINEPSLTERGEIVAEWTGEPSEVWLTNEPPDPLIVQALGAGVVHWGGYPIPEPVVEVEDPKKKALDDLIEARAKAGDAIAIAAREARKTEALDTTKEK